MKAAAVDRVAQFRRYMTIERNLSAHTDSNYARDLAALIKFCDAHKIDDWSTVDSQHIRLFAAHSHSKGLAGKSIQRRLSAVRSFFEYLVKETRVQELARERPRPNDLINVKRNPAVEVRAPKSQRRLPETLDADQMASLLEIPAGDIFVTRDRAIMELLYSSGLRLAELVDLDIDRLDLADRSVRVIGKGKKERIVPVGTEALDALQKWLKERSGFAKPGEAALFVGRGGERLGRRAVQTRVAYWARRQGVSLRVYPHLFRHSFASHLLESGGDLRGVQELLGHADIATTQIYTHLDFQHLARIYDKTHPRARRKA
ncbi:MAG TPA: tyrosine recombinase XerC [Steroidobacteraceae bacterium]